MIHEKRLAYVLLQHCVLSYRHERVMHQEVQQSEEPDPTEDKAAESDCIYNYHNARLQCGLLFLNIIDAIKEGDGCRLIQCYKVVLLFNYKFKHTKYAYILLLLFAKIFALLPEREAELLVHNRFLNKKGCKYSFRPPHGAP